MRRIQFVSLMIALIGPVAAADPSVPSPGNACDVQPQGCFGSVGYVYEIGTNEVTNQAYAQFLNVMAQSDPLGLYNPAMGSGSGGIARTGSPGSYVYTPIAGRAQRPVNFVSLYDAMRFANWLSSGGSDYEGDETEDGVYTLLGGTPIPSNGATVTRNAIPVRHDSVYFVPSEDEWYKAAYYDGATASYFDHPASSDLEPVCGAPTASPNRANCDFQPDVTNVGAYPGSASPSGTFDQAGNVWEWTETIVSAPYRGIRGGSFDVPASGSAASTRVAFPPDVEIASLGFRVAPEPGRGALFAAGGALLAGLQHRRRRSSAQGRQPEARFL